MIRYERSFSTSGITILSLVTRFNLDVSIIAQIREQMPKMRDLIVRQERRTVSM